MNLEYAVDRLYEAGWQPWQTTELETLPDGRAFPTVAVIQGEFSRVGLKLVIEHNPKFNCYRATWSPIGKARTGDKGGDGHGTVVGACQREAAVYALAQVLAAQSVPTA